MSSDIEHAADAPSGSSFEIVKKMEAIHTLERYPFDYDPARPYIPQVGDWVADVFYEILPEAGFEVRDEQIYMAFQLERAYAEKQAIFAEAGVGTGKTMAYLLYAICYARYMRKPAVIACADESLIEQLVKPEGDIAKLSTHLKLDIDARLGKSLDQYLCLVKLDQARSQWTDDDAPLYDAIYEGLPRFVRRPESQQAFHAYGGRTEYPELNDARWQRINWDTFQDCFVCEKRHRCGQTLSRDHYRKAADLIICSHDYYMEHLWTAESRKREGQLPLLPEHCAVVFDEGHLLESAALKAVSYKLKHDVFEELLLRLLNGEVRESLAQLIDRAIDQSGYLFRTLADRSQAIAGSDRSRVMLDEPLLRELRRFRLIIDEIEEALVYESELYTLNAYELRIVEEHLEMIQKALVLFERADKPICWTTERGDGLVFSIMPKTIKEILGERLFSSRMPIVFSSATLSVDGSFKYVADSLGMGDYLSFSVPSSYDYANVMQAVAPLPHGQDSFAAKARTALAVLEQTPGGALMLFRTREELQRFKREMDSSGYPDESGTRFLYEGDQEISRLISAFQADTDSVLCAVSLWEGLDVPGEALTKVIVWSLPYPPDDPVFLAKREAAADPFAEIDLPYMLLRLRQGIGRLIRTSTDHGMVAILDGDVYRSEAIRAQVEAAFPAGVALKEKLSV